MAGQFVPSQVVKYVHTSQYIGEFEMLILSSPIVIGEFWLIFSYAVMLIWREFLDFSLFWREIQLNLVRAGETNGEFVTHTILLGSPTKSNSMAHKLTICLSSSLQIELNFSPK